MPASHRVMVTRKAVFIVVDCRQYGEVANHSHSLVSKSPVRQECAISTAQRSQLTPSSATRQQLAAAP